VPLLSGDDTELPTLTVNPDASSMLVAAAVDCPMTFGTFVPLPFRRLEFGIGNEAAG
jgi:hypothetical protein